MQEKNRKSSVLTLIAGLIMIVASVINYYFNEDLISLGIFIFSGLGFIMLSVAEKQKESSAKRLKKYAFVFFLVSVLVLIYWLFAGKLNII